MQELPSLSRKRTNTSKAIHTTMEMKMVVEMGSTITGIVRRSATHVDPQNILPETVLTGEMMDQMEMMDRLSIQAGYHQRMENQKFEHEQMVKRKCGVTDAKGGELDPKLTLPTNIELLVGIIKAMVGVMKMKDHTQVHQTIR